MEENYKMKERNIYTHKQYTHYNFNQAKIDVLFYG